MEFEYKTISDHLLKSETLFNPFSNNSYRDKKFELKETFMGELRERISVLIDTKHKKSQKEARELIILKEAYSSLEKSSIRDYHTINYTSVDNQNLVTCLGGNNANIKYKYGAIYDISNLITVILSCIFSSDIRKFENNLVRYCETSGIDLNSVAYLLGDRFETCDSNFFISDLDMIDVRYRSFCRLCLKKYASDSLELGRNKIMRGEYTDEEIIGMCLSFYITRSMELILNDIMGTKCQVSSGVEPQVVVHTKGLTNVYLTSNDLNALNKYTFIYRGEEIEVKPIVGRLDEIGYKFLDSKTNNLELISI